MCHIKETLIFLVCQLSPFPYDLVKQEIEKYKNAKICYSQEEHKNGGAYDFVKARLQTILLKLNDSRVNQLT
jgi:2-oxoglutarate dehydrogenase E1 component